MPVRWGSGASVSESGHLRLTRYVQPPFQTRHQQIRDYLRHEVHSVRYMNTFSTNSWLLVPSAERAGEASPFSGRSASCPSSNEAEHRYHVMQGYEFVSILRLWCVTI